MAASTVLPPKLKRALPWAIAILAVVLVIVSWPHFHNKSRSKLAPTAIETRFHFRIAWPSEPNESGFDLPPPHGAPGNANGSLQMAQSVEKRPEGTVIYSVSVIEQKAAPADGAARKEILEGAATASKTWQKSRRDLEFGPRNYPGVEIETNFNGRIFHHDMLILAGQRLFTIGIASKHSDYLNDSTARDFFESLSIDD